MLLNLTERQEQIIRLAIQIISEDGLLGLSIRKLADRVGVTEAAIYRHFKDKADMMAKILLFMRSNQESATRWAEELPAIEAIQEFHQDLVEFASQNPDIAETLHRMRASQRYARLSGEHLEIRRAHRGPLVKFIERGQNEGNIRSDIPSDQIAAIIRRTMHGLMVEWHISGRDFDLVARWEATWRALRKMIEVIK
jgi:AcrR family transcriptional regulator